MAAGRIDIAVGLQDDELKKGIKNIPKQFKKAGLEQFVKLKLDASDFRVQVQQEVKEAMKAANKAGALSYTNKAGQNINVDPTAWKSTSDAMKRFTDLGMTHQVKALERLRAALYLLGNDYKQHTAQMKSDLDMPTRLTRARNSGLVQAERQRIAREASQKEKLLVIEKQLADVERRRIDNQKLTVNTNQRLQNEIALTQKKLGLLRQIDLIQNGGKPSVRTLTEESRLRNLQHTNSLLQQQGSILGRLKGLAQQYLSIFSVLNFGNKIVETTGYFEQQKVALEGILGSAADAEKAFTRMQKMALQSPFELKDIVGQTRQAAAYGIGDGDTKKLLDDVKMLGDLSAGLGVDMQRLILAYGQVKAAAVLRGQELRQFTEAGIPMVQALADKFTQLNGKLVTTGEVFELISKRKVSFEMVSSVLRDMTAEGGKFNDMQEKITETLYGQVQKLKDMWTQALNSMGSGISQYLMNIIKRIQKVVKNMSSIFKAGMFVAIIAGLKKLGISLVVFGNRVGGVRRAIASMRAEIALANGGMAKFGAVARGAGRILTSGWASALAIVGSAIIGVVAKMREARKEVERNMSQIADSFDKDTRNMINGIDHIASVFRVASVGTKQFGDAASTLVSNYGKFIGSDITEALMQQGNAAEKAAQQFLGMVEAVKLAIQEQQQWLKLKEKADSAAQTAGQRAGETAGESKWHIGTIGDVNILRKSTWNGGQGSTSSLISGVSSFLRNNEGVTEEVLLKSISEMFGSAMETAAKNGKKFDDSKDAIKGEFAALIKSAYGLDDTTISSIFDNAIKSVSKNTRSAFDTAAANAAAANSTTYAILVKPFEKLDKVLQTGKYADGRDAIGREDAKANLAYDALSVAFRNGVFDGYQGSELQKLIESEDHNTDSAYKIVDAIREFSKGKAPEIVAQLSLLGDRFQKYAELRQGHSARIAGSFRDEKSKVYGWREDEDLKDIAATYGNPTVSNIDALRKQLVEDEAAAVKRKKEIEALGDVKNYKADLDKLNKRIKAYKVLMGDQFYGIAEKKTGGGGGGSQPRLANFMNDFLQTIINADKDVKKIAQVTGYTGAMTDFVGELKDDNILKKFFQSGANPFQKFFDEMKEYGITQDMVPGLNANVVQTIMKEVGWEEGKTMDLPDFEKMYDKILEFFEKEVYPKITDQRIRESVGKAIGDWRLKSPFGRNEIDDKLTAMLKTLSDIEKDFQIANLKRSQYEKLRSVGGYESSYRAVYGGGWQHYDPRDATQKAMLGLLNVEGGNGTFSTYIGEELTNMLNSGQSLNIDSLRMLNEAKKRIDEQQSVYLQAAQNGDKEAVKQVEQFSKVSKSFDKAIDNMIESIIKAYESIPRTDIEQTTIALENFFEQFKQNDATITKEGGENVNARRIENAKTLYDNLSKQLGGTGNLAFARGGGGQMSAGLQNFLGGMSGQVNFQQAIGNILGGQVQAGGMSASAAAGVASAAGGSIAMVDAIIKAVYQTIKAIGDMIKATQKVMKSMNKVTVSVDKNGNKVYKKKYDDYELERVEKATDIAMTFNQHVMDGWEKFKSGDFLGALTEIYTSITDMISSINAFLDSDVRNEIEKLIDSNKSLEKSIDRAEWASSHQSGIVAMNTKGGNIARYMEKYKNLTDAYNMEINNTKSPDTDKLETYDKEAETARRAAIDLWSELKEEIIGTADELSSTLTDAFVNAFKNGTNAARDWAASVKSYMGEVMQTMILEKVLAPKIQEVFDNWMGGTEEELVAKNGEGFNYGDYMLERLMDESAGKQAQKELYALGDWMTDYYEGLGQWTKDMIAFNPDTTSISGGIQGMTEDTGRTLEGLGNSILMQHVLTNQKMDEIKSLPFAQVQTSWFKDMLMQSKAIATATADMRNAIADMRNGVRPLYVTMQ